MLHRQLQETFAELEVEHAEQRRLIAELAEAHGQLVQSEKMVAIGQLAAASPTRLTIQWICDVEFRQPGALPSCSLDLIALYDEALPQIPTELRDRIAAAKQTLDFDYIHDDARDLINESKDGLER